MNVTIKSVYSNKRTARLTALLLCGLGVFHFALASTASGPDVGWEQHRSDRNSAPRSGSANTRRDYSKFSHNVAQHKIACNSCHKLPTANWNKVRTGEGAFPDVTDYPEHSSCIGCHRQQFFVGAQPVICRVCHTNPSPRDSSRHPFPNPPEIFNASEKGRNKISEFGISFPHDKHVDLVGLNQSNPAKDSIALISFVSWKATSQKKEVAEESDPKSCAVCHKTYQPQGDLDDEYLTKPPKNLPEDAFWLKKGTFKTSPNHSTCFTCHAPEGLQPTSSDCSTCHKLLAAPQQIQLTQAHNDFDPKLAARMEVKDKATLERWSRRDTAKFRHEWIPHATLSCVTCHNIGALNTLDPKTRTQVKSCGGSGTGCHIEATTDGILNLELSKKKANPTFQCTKCHVLNGKNSPPQSHLSALAPTKK